MEDFCPNNSPASFFTTLLLDLKETDTHKYCDQGFHNCGNFEKFDPQYLVIKIQ